MSSRSFFLFVDVIGLAVFVGGVGVVDGGVGGIVSSAIVVGGGGRVAVAAVAEDGCFVVVAMGMFLLRWLADLTSCD